MKEVSNRMLVGLLVVAIVVSLVGTLVSLNKMGDMQAVTGLAGANVTSQTGTVNVSLLQTAEITKYGNINWGSGNVLGNTTTGHDFCELIAGARYSDLQGSGYDFSSSTGAVLSSQSTACDPFDVGIAARAFVIVNTGNMDFSTLTVASGVGQNEATDGPGAWDDIFSSAVANGTYQWRTIEQSAAGGECASHQSTWTPFTETPVTACTTFSYSPDDAIAIEVNATIPEDAPDASFGDTVTFTANI